MIEDSVDQIFVSFTTALGIALTFGLLSKYGKVGQPDDDGVYKSINIPKWVYKVTLLFGVGFGLIGLAVIWLTDEPYAGLFFIILGLLFPIVLYLIDRYCFSEIRWNHLVIEGPTGFFGLKEAKYEWSHARTLQRHENRNLYITFNDNNKIFILIWSKGWTDLVNDIRRYAPHVLVQEEIVLSITPH